MRRIDAHQHYWDPIHGDYGWLGPQRPVLHRPFAPPDLAPALAAADIAGTVLVQAAPTVAETERLLTLAARTPSVLGVVGWVDFERPGAGALERLAEDRTLVGLRPMLHNLPDPAWVLRDDLAWAFDAIEARGLAFDALVRPPHLGALRALMERRPSLRVVIDHGAKPAIARADFEGWARDMGAIARDSRAVVKVSGLATEAGPGWTGADLAPYVGLLLDRFGPDRLMFGSDWPVCLEVTSYARWVETVEHFLAHLTDRERAMVMGGTAAAAYRLASTVAGRQGAA